MSNPPGPPDSPPGHPNARIPINSAPSNPTPNPTTSTTGVQQPAAHRCPFTPTTPSERVLVDQVNLLSCLIELMSMTLELATLQSTERDALHRTEQETMVSMIQQLRVELVVMDNHVTEAEARMETRLEVMRGYIETLEEHVGAGQQSGGTTGAVNSAVLLREVDTEALRTELERRTLNTFFRHLTDGSGGRYTQG